MHIDLGKMVFDTCKNIFTFVRICDKIGKRTIWDYRITYNVYESSLSVGLYIANY